MNDPENSPIEIKTAAESALLELTRELMYEVETNERQEFGVSANQVGMFYTSIKGGILPITIKETDGDDAFGIDSSDPKKPKLVIDQNKLVNLDPEDSETKKLLLHELSHYVHATSTLLINTIKQQADALIASQEEQIS